MQPTICDEKQFILIGMSFYGDPFDCHAGWDEDNQIGRLWKRFFRYYYAGHPELQQAHVPGAMYEVHLYNEETQEKGVFEVFVGVEAKPAEIDRVPVELCVKVLPATQYAVFTFQGEQIIADWEMDLQNWLENSGYHSPHAYNFQYYDERFKGMDRLAESALDVYVPIQAAA